MKKIVIITASARTQVSHSRNLSETFIEYWKKSNLNHTVTFRELGNTNIQHVNENWLIATSKAETERNRKDQEILKFSNTCIEELKNSDVIVIATPMYNWSIPSTLKAYIDQVMRINETFTVQYENGKQVYSGLLKGKSLFLLLSRGGMEYEKGENNAHMNFQNTYLRIIFGIMGITNIHEIIIDGTSQNNDTLHTAINTAQIKIQKLIEQEFNRP
jgi:FMN-dependent NADH-azoreductase